MSGRLTRGVRTSYFVPAFRRNDHPLKNNECTRIKCRDGGTLPPPPGSPRPEVVKPAQRLPGCSKCLSKITQGRAYWMRHTSVDYYQAPHFFILGPHAMSD